MDKTIEVAAVTSFAPHAWETTAKDCITSLHQFWPPETYLYSVWEGKRPVTDIIGTDLNAIPAARSFIERHAKNGEVKGLVEGRLKWGHKAREYGYNFRTDAYKFARKVYAIAHIAPFRKGRLFWVDADVITRQAVPRDFLVSLLPDDCSVAYLARPGYHSELGFLGLNLNHPATARLIGAWQELYDTDSFMHLAGGWTDCHTFDYLVQTQKPPVREIRHTSNSQPFDHSCLARYMIHLKGARKPNHQGVIEDA